MLPDHSMHHYGLPALLLALLLGAGGCTRHGGSANPGENVSGASGAGGSGATSGETANSPGGGQGSGASGSH